jgi:hypothetical protein
LSTCHGLLILFVGFVCVGRPYGSDTRIRVSNAEKTT